MTPAKPPQGHIQSPLTTFLQENGYHTQKKAWPMVVAKLSFKDKGCCSFFLPKQLQLYLTACLFLVIKSTIHYKADKTPPLRSLRSKEEVKNKNHKATLYQE